MQKKPDLLFAIFISSLCISLASCNFFVSNKNLHKAVPVATRISSINLYAAQEDPDIRVVIESPATQQTLVGMFAKVPKVAESSAPNADISVEKTAKVFPGDALTFAWKDSWRAALNFETGSSTNLSHYMPAGTIEFDLNVIELVKGGLAFKTKCVGSQCERKVDYLLKGRELAGKGWQHISVALSCFMQEGDDFSATHLPFALEVGGEGKLAIANVSIQKNGSSTVACPDYKAISTTPSMLIEWWSTSWWLPRHLQKLDEIKTHNNAQIVFIGDSITQGWEKDGFNVWNRYYKKYNAIALGFGGDRTENILWRLQHGEVEGLKPKVAVLMFGTNNTGSRHEKPGLAAAGIKRNIEELQQRLPNTKILLLAIFPRDEKPDGELRLINNDINAIIATFADNKKIFFLDINKYFLDKNGLLSKTIMPDFLHLNEQGYELWANAMQPTLLSLLK